MHSVLLLRYISVWNVHIDPYWRFKECYWCRWVEAVTYTKGLINGFSRALSLSGTSNIVAIFAILNELKVPRLETESYMYYHNKIWCYCSICNLKSGIFFFHFCEMGQIFNKRKEQQTQKWTWDFQHMWTWYTHFAGTT